MAPYIRVRACVALVRAHAILLVPHYHTDAGPIQWHLPGGSIEYGEPMHNAAVREVLEETGLHIAISGLLDVSEVILPERPWHSISITFTGQVLGGNLLPEADHPHGQKIPHWLTAEELIGVPCHPPQIIAKALALGIRI